MYEFNWVMNKKIALGQFYTPPSIARPMIEMAISLLNKTPKNAIELAAGQGDLIIPLNEILPNCQITAVDLDFDNTEFLKKNFNHLKVYCHDSTQSLSFLKDEKFDLALGNPPFLSKVELNDSLKCLLKDYLDLDLKKEKFIRAELIFICQYLSLISESGILAIILPESLISGQRFVKFREAILKKWKIERIVEITGKPFSFTEAKTHILFIRKIEKANRNIPVSRITEYGEIIHLKSIPTHILKHRMDFSYLEQFHSNSKLKRLGDVAVIQRGKKTHQDLVKQGLPYLHTTNLSSVSNLPLEKDKEYSKSLEILVCRVGTRVIGKSTIYKGGPIEISDCLYKIQFKDKSLGLFFYEYINSEIGQKKLKSLARGVCSRYITKGDLQDFMF